MVMGSYRPPPEAGHTYAWNIFSRPWLMTSSSGPQPISWRQYDLDHPRPSEGILFDPERNGFYSWSKSNRTDTQSFTSQDGISDLESWSQSTVTSHNVSGYDVNGNRVPSNTRQRSYGRRDGFRNQKTHHHRSVHPQRKFWPKRMGEQYWDDDQINFYGRQNPPVTSEGDSWRKLARPKTGSLYAPGDGQFYHWAGHNNTNTDCLDVSLIMYRCELRRLFPEEDSEDEESAHFEQETRKEVQRYSAFRKDLMKRRHAMKAA
ncbi:hypothetical protein EGW08_003632 [Elysia chlorotica]|uniref:Uncharacterized protein n=1 Tax=Elysia chlorotica TaxID=188477 RepID=A0A433U460_ELYCH|nr:hypothetical protein EGW08_003632 [Elysia chlorotica]